MHFSSTIFTILQSAIHLQHAGRHFIHENLNTAVLIKEILTISILFVAILKASVFTSTSLIHTFYGLLLSLMCKHQQIFHGPSN